MGIFIIILLGVGLYFLLNNGHKTNIKIPGLRNAEETLRHRYANGEIDEETYLKMKQTLKD